jgi:phosphoserine phosphatase
MTKLLLTRHGHVEGIDPVRFRGRADLELTRLGIAEAERLARRIGALSKPVAILSSPSKRCLRTAQTIAAACGLRVQSCEKVNDIDYGSWQFRTHDEVKLMSPGLFAAWFATPERVRFPDGESLQDVAARTSDSLRVVLSQYPNETVVIVAHDSVNRVILSQLIGLPLSAYWRFAQQPCCINEIDIAQDSCRILRLNDTSHLDDLK